MVLVLFDFLLDSLEPLCLAHLDRRRNGRTSLTSLPLWKAFFVLVGLHHWQLAYRGRLVAFKVVLRLSQFFSNLLDGFLGCVGH